MIVLGSISGIQTYLFDVADEGGGQARRLRARSYYIQLLAESAMLRVLQALDWPPDEEHQLFTAAGKFALQGNPPTDAARRLETAHKSLNQWLLATTSGEIHLSLGWSDGNDSEIARYREANRRLGQAKLRAWSALGSNHDGWTTSTLQLKPLAKPCALCRRRTASTQDRDPESGVTRMICSRCDKDREDGRQLPRAKWLLLSEQTAGGGEDVFGLRYELSSAPAPAIDAATLAVVNLTDPDRPPPDCPPEKLLKRRFVRHIPVDEDGHPIWFTELARRARGAPLLGVLKADADSLGRIVERLAQPDLGLGHLRHFSKSLEEFFAGHLARELRNSRWHSIYPVFAGGDDLLFVGPWDVVCDFAGHMQRLFRERFGRFRLTISAGLALIRPKFPIKHAAEQAENLLEQAKTVPALDHRQPKDQMAAFGQIWKWRDHDQILRHAKRLARWVDDRVIERGWLHTLLQFAEARDAKPANSLSSEQRDSLKRSSQLAPARLANHIARNYPGPTDRNPARRAFRFWAETVRAGFEDCPWTVTRYLPGMLRYALTATRETGDEA